MGILNTSKPQMTDAEKIAASMDAVADLEEKGLAQLRAVRDAGHDWFWNNPLGLTPNQMFAAYGVNAWKVVTQDISTTGYVNANAPEGDTRLGPLRITVGVPDTYVLNPNPDGVVTEDNPQGYGSVTVRPKLYVETVAGARVVIGDQTIVADATGLATVTLPEAEYSGTCSLDGHDDSTFTVSLTRGGQKVTSKPILITGILTITGPTGASVTVTSTATGEQTSFTLDPVEEGSANGNYAIQEVPGSYTVTSVLEGWMDAPVSVTLTRDGATIACGLTPA